MTAENVKGVLSINQLFNAAVRQEREGMQIEDDRTSFHRKPPRLSPSCLCAGRSVPYTGRLGAWVCLPIMVRRVYKKENQ